ncbi:MarR family winged helix-turn-helix transcriptional regulator [Neogemmobacter tilapiae]|uniref:MarR family transcriptional regulator n=1 Tax=Neogemmobacter tilapiae TaxID=875041 RepID=A0A918TTD8_9RHOB|nr:MarR family transcriptional regulator [Gemmobacter tilapiae]GHC55774.1 MarR family transcriptional regulator [Gemmobacter tilapiae]
MTHPALNDHICFALYGAHQAMSAAYKPLLEPLGLTYPQYLVLLLLWEQDDQTVGGIGGKLGLQSNTLTPLLKRMEQAGFVKRTRSAADERQVRIGLTEAGRGLQAASAHVPGCIMKATGLEMPALHALHQQISALRDRLQDS